MLYSKSFISIIILLREFSSSPLSPLPGHPTSLREAPETGSWFLLETKENNFIGFIKYVMDYSEMTINIVFNAQRVIFMVTRE